MVSDIHIRSVKPDGDSPAGVDHHALPSEPLGTRGRNKSLQVASGPHPVPENSAAKLNGRAPAAVFRINLAASRFVLSSRRQRGRPPHTFDACEWDDVAFRRKPGKRYCSARCEAADEAHQRREGVRSRDAQRPQRTEILDLESLAQLHVNRWRHLPSLGFQEKRRGLHNRSPVDLGPRALELEMRVEDFFAPFRRRVWVGPNLAVLE